MSDANAEQPEFSSDDSTDSPPAGLSPGEILDGRYQIIELIKTGRNGAVYKAMHQLMRRVVSVTVMSASESDATQALDRFKREGRNISLLEHPNVVSIYDFGMSPDGKLYMVTDYLEGGSLADLLKREGKLTVDRTVRIAVQILKGLAHAHERGMAHRSLKPDSILFADDKKGGELVRITDFGVSKLLTATEGQSLTQTQSGNLLFNPAYASPEQWLGRPVDARSDLYSLGCIMFELLEGHPPFSGSSDGDVMVEQIGRIPVLPENAAPASLRCIVLKALEKDSDKRFKSANEMLEAFSTAELRRLWQETEAGAPGAGRGLMIPRPGPWQTSALVVLLFLALSYVCFFHTEGGATLTAELISFLPPEENVLNLSRRLAQQFQNEKHFGAAASLYAYIVEHSSSSSLQKLDALISRYKCETALSDNEAKKRDELLIRTTLQGMEREASLRKDIGEQIEAGRRLLEMEELRYGPNSTQVAQQCVYLAFYNGTAENWQEQRRFWSRALDIYARRGLPQVPTLVVQARIAAESLEKLGKTKEAEDLLRDMLAVADRTGLSCEKRAPIYTALASMLAQQKRFGELEALYKQELSAQEKITGHFSSTTGSVYLVLGDQEKALKKWREALESYKNALAIFQKAEGPYSNNVNATLESLIGCYQELGDFDSAAQAASELAEIWEHKAGPQSRDLLSVLDVLGSLYVDGKRFAEAESTWKRILSFTQSGKTLDKTERARILCHLGLAYSLENKISDEEKIVAEIANLCNEGCPPVTLDYYADSLGGMAADYKKNGQFARAIELLNRQMAIVAKTKGRDSLAAANVFFNLGESKVQLKQLAEAEKDYLIALGIHDRINGTTDWDSFPIVWGLAIALEKEKKHDQAKAIWNRALIISASSQPERNAHYAFELGQLARDLDTWGYRAQATDLWLQAFEFNLKLGNPELQIVTDQGIGAACDLKALNKTAEAEACLRQLISYLEKKAGESAAILANPLLNLSRLYAETGRTAESEQLKARADRLSAKK